MKILHLIADLRPKSGGPPKVALEICKQLARKGHDVAIFTTNLADHGVLDVQPNVPTQVDGITIYYFPFKELLPGYIVSFPMAKAVREQLPNFDIIETHGLYLFHTWLTRHYCRKFGKPYLVMPHGSLNPFVRNRGVIKKAIYTQLIEKKNLDYAAGIHYTAQEEMNQAHNSLHIHSPGIVIPPGLDLSIYRDLPSRGVFRAIHPELKNKYTILFLGRINSTKGLDLLARAFGQVAALRPNAHLVIAGPEDPGYGDRVRAWLADAGVLDRVTFTGMLHGQDKLAAFVDADQFVLPSYSENFGIALVEAMACGLPVITTNKVNIWKEISTAQAGEIINCNAAELRDAILKIMDNPDLAKTYASNGQKLVAEKFNWDVIADQLISEYQKIIKNFRTN